MPQFFSPYPSLLTASVTGEASWAGGSPRAGVVPDERRVTTRTSAEPAGRTPLRCLIVDDNPLFLETARFLLEREGLKVAGAASTGAEALRLASMLRPDVVLVDVMLGTESGFELARRLVADDRGGRSTVILISTHAEADFVELIEASPATGFLAKAELSTSAIQRIHDSRPR